MLKTICGAILAAAFIAPVAQAQSYTPKGPIEQKYQADGPWAVSTRATTAACDREGKLCDIWYPTNLGTNPLKGITSGFKHPVVAWANGTGSASSKYAYWLRHMATWGFIVVATRDTDTGNGLTVADSANYMIAQGGTSSSIFYNKVDGTNVGAAGHSQGGASVAKLFAGRTAPFKAFVAIHPSPMWFSGLCCSLQASQLSNGNGAIMYLNSVGDGGAGDTESNYYNRTTGATATRAFGVLANAKHDDVQGNPNCTVASCITGVYGYLGYPTAWMMWRLQGATDGAAAFSSTTGEWKLPDSDWTKNLSNVP